MMRIWTQWTDLFVTLVLIWDRKEMQAFPDIKQLVYKCNIDWKRTAIKPPELTPSLLSFFTETISERYH